MVKTLRFLSSTLSHRIKLSWVAKKNINVNWAQQHKPSNAILNISVSGAQIFSCVKYYVRNLLCNKRIVF